MWTWAALSSPISTWTVCCSNPRSMSMATCASSTAGSCGPSIGLCKAPYSGGGSARGVFPTRAEALPRPRPQFRQDVLGVKRHEPLLVVAGRVEHQMIEPQFGIVPDALDMLVGVR